MPSALISDSRLEEIIERARLKAVAQRQALCDCEQILAELLLDAGESAAAEPLSRWLADRPQLAFHPVRADLSRAFRLRAYPEAQRIASEQGEHEVASQHLLHALLAPGSPVSAELRERALGRLRARTDDRARAPVPAAEAAPSSGHAAQILVEPFTAGDGPAYLVERVELLDRLLRTALFGNPLLVGEPGSGRRSLARLLARRIERGDVPPALADWKLVSLNPTRLMAGTAYRGELEERVQTLIDDVSSRPRTFLVIENLALLLGGKNPQGGFDTAAALAPALHEGRIRLIAIATPDEVRERLEAHPAMLDALTPVSVESTGEADACRLLSALPEALADRFGVRLGEGAVARAVALCARHVPQRPLPGEAVRLLESAAGTHAFETAMRARDPGRAASRYWSIVGSPPAGEEPPVSERHLMLALAERHRIPIEHLQDGIDRKLDQLERSFRATLFGQDHVLEVVMRTVKVALLHLSDSRRPRGRLFFVGPPGTGKTECARLLARFLMGSEAALLRFDMSDYQEASAVSTLLGSDKGLVGSEEGGRLTEPLRQDPHRVVLFDEIEKAHPHVYNLFLQILDNGEIRDKRGSTVSFRHAICIFTSNAGCDGRDGLFGLTREAIEERLGHVFRPEFLNRIEDFVPFRALDREARRQVLAAQLEQFARQLEDVHGLALAWDDAVLDAGCDGRDSQPGVRGLLRWVQRVAKPAVADVLVRSPGAVGPVRLTANEGIVIASAGEAPGAPSPGAGHTVAGGATTCLEPAV